MVFSYYANLSRKHKAIYRKSDALDTIALPEARLYREPILLIKKHLQEENREQLEQAASMLLNGMASGLGAPALQIQVLNDRPSNNQEELHGLYEPLEEGRHARISVWMRTAKQKRIVAFRSFLRTLLHEFCHHIDYELFMLEESFHTQGFFKRESNLFKQLMQDLP